MPIRNYTTEVTAERSIGEIQGLLRQVKVRGATIRYDADDGEPIALYFDVMTPQWGERSYLLPADVDGVQRVLARQKGPRYATREQSVRVAWRIAKDWVAVQIAYVQAGAAIFEQAWLPYLIVEDNKTMYEWFAQRQAALPAPEEQP